MGSLWTYLEGMDGISLHFMETNSSDLAAWAGFGTSTLSSKDVCSSSMIWCSPILLCMLQHCIWVPWEAFGHILKEWMSLASSCGGKWLRFGCMGQVWHSGPLRMTFAPPV